MIRQGPLVPPISIIDAAMINELLAHLQTQPAGQTVERIHRATTNHLIIVARDMDAAYAEYSRIIGMATLVRLDLLTGTKGRIEDVVVHPDFQGQGIGKMLMRHVIHEARLGGFESVDLTSHPRREAANCLYQSLGFKPRETNVYHLELRP
ncbi:GNAT family N-acetyltransferase [Candidatus Uhrbacteria bacterium]|nr:GNAT family N-acetyltransferase [Candidatus Uhrbacteria bacterium]